MKKKRAVCGMFLLACMLAGGCSGTQEEQISANTEAVKSTEAAEPAAQSELADGIYTADFDTDGSMFRVSEACDGKGTLTVENGEMIIHVSLGSKNIVNLYPGFAEDAQKEGAKLLMPTEDTVTYSDGWTETVYGFDIPVPVLNEEFDLALIGKKGKWYDHKVTVSNPELLQEEGDTNVSAVDLEDGSYTNVSAADLDDGRYTNVSAAELEDGSYTVELTFEGGSGKTKILSPAAVTVSEDTVTAIIQWDSPNYDYMIVDEEKYLPVNTEGNSVFEIPVLVFDEPMEVIGDTVAMSKPHEIEYTLTFHSDTIKPED